MLSTVEESHGYDFEDEENVKKWRGLFVNSLKKVLEQIHPTTTIEDSALEYVESLCLKLLAMLCAPPTPRCVQDVEERVARTFPTPIDKWALCDARETASNASKRRRLNLPQERLHQMLLKEVLMYKVDTSVSVFMTAILEYVSSDILRLAGHFVKKISQKSGYETITSNDIKTAMCADKVLLDMFYQESLAAAVCSEQRGRRGSLSYAELVRDLLTDEKHFLRDLHLIIRVFKDELEKILDKDTRTISLIFGNIVDIYELTVTLLGNLEDAMEMSQDSATPYIGSCFEELAEVEEFRAYVRYANIVTRKESRDALQNIVAEPAFSERLDTAGHGFRLAVKYYLPKLLLAPVAHVFLYHSYVLAMLQVAPATDDRESFKQVRTGGEQAHGPPVKYYLPKLLLAPVAHVFLYHSYVLAMLQVAPATDDRESFKQVRTGGEQAHGPPVKYYLPKLLLAPVAHVFLYHSYVLAMLQVAPATDDRESFKQVRTGGEQAHGPPVKYYLPKLLLAPVAHVFLYHSYVLAMLQVAPATDDRESFKQVRTGGEQAHGPPVKYYLPKLLLAPVAHVFLYHSYVLAMLQVAPATDDRESFKQVRTGGEQAHGPPVKYYLPKVLLAPVAHVFLYHSYVLAMLQASNFKLQNSLFKFIADWPNSYAFTKALAEEAVRTMSGDLPICIVRPAIVISSYLEPTPGWLDISSVYGPSGLLLGTGLGVMHTFMANDDTYIDLIPVDFVNNATIAAAWATASRQGQDIKIYTVSPARNPIKWRKLFEIMYSEAIRFTTPKCLWYNFDIHTKYRWLFMILTVLFHFIPACLADGALLLLGKKPKAFKIYRTAYNLSTALSYFTCHEFYFQDDNLQLLEKSMSKTDKQIYNFDIEKMNWEEQFVLWAIGLRKYIIKDGLKDTEYGQKKQKVLRILNYIVGVLYFYALYKLFSYVFWFGKGLASY